jgi:ABC-2 type transport system ATP-binding protein
LNEVTANVEFLSKRFNKSSDFAIDNISFQIPKGKIVGLVGPDGSGKTTLIRLIAGLLTPSSGKITIFGLDSEKYADQIRFSSSYMPQKFGLYEDLTVEENLNLYAELKNLPHNLKKETFEKLLHFTDLKNFLKFYAKDLSGGMKQKLGLACALIKDPKFLLLDEPSVGVDPISRRELWKMVKALQEKEDITVIWSTSYLDEAELCDEVILLSNGKLLYNGHPKELTDRMKGRSFEIKDVGSDKRELLFSLLNREEVMDGVIRGNDIRICVKPNQMPKGINAIEVKPRFEDAFVDILGGGPGGYSKLKEITSPIQNVIEKPIVANSLTKKFGNFEAVSNVNIEVNRKEIFGLLGPNGSGKTTTFKMLCGLLPPTHGSAFINNMDLQVAPSKARQKIGYMAQKFSLYGNLTVKQNLSFFAGMYNLKNSEKARAIEEMIEIFDLGDFLSSSVEMLPLGFKQRMALACANMHHPEVLFLDEPTSGVDPVVRREFWNHINGLVSRGATIMVTTHFMEEAEYCDRIGLIYQGKLIQCETPNKLKDLAKSEKNLNPTLEDAFIHLIEEYDGKR